MKSADLFATGSVAALSVLLNRAVPRGWEIPANLSGAALMVGMAATTNADLRAYGFARGTLERGLRQGAAFGVPLGLIAAAGGFFPFTSRFFRTELIVQSDAGEAAYHALLRIPNATAVSEELIFRTALEATFASGHSRLWAALAGAKLFGLWHILPAMDRLRSNPGVTGANPVGVIAAAVVTTAVAGLGFSWLRERSNSILTPIIVHAAINVGAFSGGWIAHRRNRVAAE